MAALKGLDSNSIFLGNGSDEAIDLLIRIFCEPAEDNVVAISPTYGMYRVCADINNVEYRPAPLNNDFSLNPENIRRAVDRQTKILFICSPNNPTSNSFSQEEILAISGELDLITVVDEAYIDFSERESLSNALSEHTGLVILQTFSKAWGLAGIRLGMALADPGIISLLRKVKYPYNLNMLTQQFALETLSDNSKKEKWVEEILKNRARLELKMKMYRFVEEVYPSDANFILVKVQKPKKVYNFLVGKKIIVRDRSNVELLDGCLRITVGSKEENSALTEALWKYQMDFVETCDL